MKLALLEMRRDPGRFVVAGAALAVLVLLMLFLGKLTDGLFLDTTGAVRVHEADRYVYADNARESLQRSWVTDFDLDTVAELAAQNGADVTVGGFSISVFGLSIPGEDEVVKGAVGGYQFAGGGLPDPPADGEALADRRLEAAGVEVGDVVLVGPAKTPITIVGWVQDSNHLLQNTVWVNGETWRFAQNENRPFPEITEDEWQIGLMRFSAGAPSEEALREIEATVGVDVLTEQEAINAIPGVTAQRSTLSLVIYVTAFVMALVVALFFALMTLERSGIYAVLKATGASNRSLIAGLIMQSVLVAVGAYAIGGLLSWLLGAVTPAAVPIQYTPGRAIFVLVAVVVAAVLGSLVSLRRVLKIEPAAAIGAGL